jgi:hypothetical protein
VRKKSQFTDRIFWDRKVYFGTVRFSRSKDALMGFNRRKMEDRRREATEKEGANRRATDAQVLEDAERLITAWNERQAKRMPMLFSPTIGAANPSQVFLEFPRPPPIDL